MFEVEASDWVLLQLEQHCYIELGAIEGEVNRTHLVLVDRLGMGSCRVWEVAAAMAVMVMATLLTTESLVEAQLQYGYYDHLGCSGVEDRVTTLVRRSYLTDATASAAMLRLAFHDCQVVSAANSIKCSP